MTSLIELRFLRDEVVVLGDDADALGTLGRGRWQVWMGLDPGQLKGADGGFDFPEARVLGDRDEGEPADRFVARCNCGQLGCGVLVARVTRFGGRVIWDQFRDGSNARAERREIDADPIEFEMEQYDAALRGRLPEAPGNRRRAGRRSERGTF